MSIVNFKIGKDDIQESIRQALDRMEGHVKQVSAFKAEIRNRELEIAELTRQKTKIETEYIQPIAMAIRDAVDKHLPPPPPLKEVC